MLIDQPKVRNTNRLNLIVSALILVLAFTLFPTDVLAQGTVSSFKNLKKIVVAVGNIVFVIIIVWGLITTVGAFISNSPNAVRNLLMLIVGCILWYGFNTVVEDITTSVGGSSTGGFDQQ